MKSKEDCPRKLYCPGMICRHACDFYGTCKVGRRAKTRKPVAIFHSHGFYKVRRPK